jgi:L-lactate dehydrogenase
MVSAPIAEIVLRDERAVVPIGVFHLKFGVTLSMSGILGRDGVSRILEPSMSVENFKDWSGALTGSMTRGNESAHWLMFS